MKPQNKFLMAMGKAKEDPSPPEAQSKPELIANPTPPSRVGAKHLGAYFDKRDPILERVAILRTRLDMTNSELIEHALNELWRRHEAGRAFGDDGQ